MITLPLTRPQFESIRTLLRERGITLRDDEGTVKHKGAVVGYKYSPDSATIDITILVKPVLLSREMVEKKVKEWFEELMQEDAGKPAVTTTREKVS